MAPLKGLGFPFRMGSDGDETELSGDWGPFWPEGNRMMGVPSPEAGPHRLSFFLASLGILAILVATELTPSLGSNEWVYLLKPKALVDPDFLPGYFEGEQSVVTAFWAVGAALFILLRDSLLVALVGRVLGWVFVVYSLSQLCKVLGIRGRAFFLGASLWILTGQSLMAGEWIFGGIEQKVFGYGFLFLALGALLRRRGFQAGMFSGLAIAFHILIGGWGTMALAAAAVASMRQLGRRTILSFFSTAFVLGFPFLLLAVRSQVAQVEPGLSAPASFDPIGFVVLVRNPHHLDPDFFMSAKEFAKLALMATCLLFMVGAARQTGKGRLLSVFLISAVGLFFGGLLARGAGLFSFLYFYPFRLADALLPLFFWLVGLEFGWRTIGAVIPLRPRRALPPARNLALLGLFFVVALEMARDLGPNLTLNSRAVVDGWMARISHEVNPFDAMAAWMRENTDRGVIVAAPPCRGDLTIKAEREVVLSFKSGPYANDAYGWYQRIKTLNGGKPLDGVGFGICQQLEENFDQLDIATLERVRDSYSADLYLTGQAREDLARYLIHGNGNFHLYDLRSLGSRESSPGRALPGKKDPGTNPLTELRP